MFIILDEARRQNCMAYLAGLHLAPKTHCVEIKEYRKNRSNAQNRTYWMWLNAIAPETGYSAEDLHEVFKQRFLGLEERIVSFTRNGHVVREIMCRPKSTSGLTVAEFSDYLRKVETLTVSMGIRLAYPDDFKYAMEG